MIVVATAAAALSGCNGLAGPPPRLRVELWGDSLSAQAASYFSFFLGITGKADARTHVYGGTALCSWLGDIASEINPANRSGFHPQVALLQFSGNNFGPCMAGKNGVPLVGQALTDKYAADSATAVAMFAKAKIPVYFVSSPIARSYAGQYVGDTPLGAMYAKLPGQHRAGGMVRFIDAALAVEWHGRYTPTLPVKPWETPTGRWPDGTKTVVVRQSDGTHFCPAPQTVRQGVVPSCPVYSGGAERFALAMTGRIVNDYRLG